MKSRSRLPWLWNTKPSRFDLGLCRLSLRAVVDALCSLAHQQKIFHTWRPFLRDPDDDLVLEVAAAAEKLSSIGTVDDLRSRAERADLEAFDRIMAKVPGRQPDPGDELPPNYKRKKRG